MTNQSAHIKQCECCGEAFSRPSGTNRISDQRWADRNNCSFRCAFYHATGKGGPKPQGDETQSRAAAACDAHLRALVRYGLRHDGLPGLPANDLLRLAAELGVAA
jgi:hypothetical protein